MSRLLSNVSSKEIVEEELQEPFMFEGHLYHFTCYMSAWVYYNYATNYKKRKMNGEQYWVWRRKMCKEGKRYFFHK